MALGTPTLCTGTATGSSNTDGATISTASDIDPTDGSPVFVAVGYVKLADEVEAVTCSGLGATWTLVESIDNPTPFPDNRLRVFVADEASYSTGAITFTANGSDTFDWATWVVFEIANADTTMVQTATNYETLNSAPNNANADFGGATSTSNTVVGVFTIRGGGYAATATGSFTDLGAGVLVGKGATEVHYLAGSSVSDVNADWNNGATITYHCIIGLEIQEAVAGGPTTSGSTGSPRGVMRGVLRGAA